MTALDPIPPPAWRVHSSAHRDAARALEMLHVQLISAVIDPYSWKWVTLAAYHAVRCFALASLGSTETAAPDRGDVEPPWLRCRRSDRGREDLPSLVHELGDRRPPDPEGILERDLAALSAARSVFVDTLPETWELDPLELIRAVRGGLELIEATGWNPGSIAWNPEVLGPSARARHAAALEVLDELERRYTH